MRHRMYVSLPDAVSARSLMDDLLLARVEERHMHFLGRRGSDLDGLHEASYLHKTDAVHAGFLGLVLGGAMGALLGTVLVNYPPQGVSPEMVAVLICALVGAVLGAWVSTMVGLQVPNSRLRAFQDEIEDGRILLILDVPGRRYEEVRAVIARKHPEALDRGPEPTVPAFP